MQYSDSYIVAPQLILKHLSSVPMSVEDQEQLAQSCVLISEMVALLADSWRSRTWLGPFLRNGAS